MPAPLGGCESNGAVPQDAVRVAVGEVDLAFFASTGGGSSVPVCLVELQQPTDSIGTSGSLTSPPLDGFSRGFEHYRYGLVEDDVATVRIYPGDGAPIDAATHAVVGSRWRVWAVEFEITRRVRAVDFLATDGHVIDHVGRPT